MCSTRGLNVRAICGEGMYDSVPRYSRPPEYKRLPWSMLKCRRSQGFKLRVMGVCVAIVAAELS